MAEDHGASEAGKLPRAWTRGCKETESRQRASGAKSQIGGEEKWQTCWCCRDQQRTCIMAQASAEKLEHTGPAEKERVALVPSREQLASTLELPLPKRKGTESFVQSTRS